ncbi:hypothetical protein BS78_03G177800 [Paspalum vaginatum]|nr:hypothetical protein BS78_03G177800 [Paspalum vaginatum]
MPRRHTPAPRRRRCTPAATPSRLRSTPTPHRHSAPAAAWAATDATARRVAAVPAVAWAAAGHGRRRPAGGEEVPEPRAAVAVRTSRRGGDGGDASVASGLAGEEDGA